MGKTGQLVLFALDRQRFALPLAMVRRVVRAVEVTALPNAPGVVAGVVDLQGELVTVFDIRARLGLRRRPVGLADQFLIASANDRTVALAIDHVEGLTDGAPTANPCEGAPWFDPFQGVAQLEDGLVLIQDLDRFLSPDEAQALDRALEGAH